MKREGNKTSELNVTDKITDALMIGQQSERQKRPHSFDDLKLFHELQVLQLEMAMQNEEFQENEHKSKEIAQKYIALFESAPYGYFILNQSGFIREVNQSGASLFGIERNDMVGKLFLELILPGDNEIFRGCLSLLFETKSHQICEVRMLKSQGQQFQIRLALSMTAYEDEILILIAVTDITMLKMIEEAQSFLLGFGWAKSGKDFFEDLAEYLGKTLGMEYICIDELVEGGLEAQTVAVFFEDNIQDNVRYRLNDTPCGKVVGQMVCCYPSKVRHLFPKDRALKQMNAESYVGITLWGSEGKPIGLIAVIGRRQLSDPHLIEALLKLVSIRAAGELEHRQLENKILKSYDQLEHLVNERTEDLQKANELLKNEIKLREQNEHFLEWAEEKYRTVADFTYNCETWMGPDGNFIYVSPSFSSLTGYPVGEVMNDPSLILKIVHPDDREIIERHYKETLKESIDNCSFDFRIITITGELRWIGHSCKSVFNSDGKWNGQRGSNRDITEQKRADGILIESQKQLRALTQRIDAIAEEERTNIAREIHDELGHLLTVLKFDIEGLSNKSGLSLEVKSELESMLNMVEALIDTVRKIATELRPGILDHLGLFPAIEWQFRQLQKRSKICCEYKAGEMDITFDKNETTIIFRIVQEILTNVARHSKANKVTMSLSKKDDFFILTATDNGIGFELTESKKEVSFGLMGMRERAMSIGGEINVNSQPGKGTTVTLVLRKN